MNQLTERIGVATKHAEVAIEKATKAAEDATKHAQAATEKADQAANTADLVTQRLSLTQPPNASLVASQPPSAISSAAKNAVWIKQESRKTRLPVAQGDATTH